MPGLACNYSTGDVETRRCPSGSQWEVIGLNALLRLLPHSRYHLGAHSPRVCKKLPVHSLLLSCWSETTHMTSREVCYLCGVAVYPAKTLMLCLQWKWRRGWVLFLPSPADHSSRLNAGKREGMPSPFGSQWDTIGFE